MPEIGEIRKSGEIGLADASSRYIYRICPRCGIGQWVRISRNKAVSTLCRSCSNKTKGKFILEDHPPKGTIESPEIGDYRRGGEIGLDSTKRYIYHACADCGKTRWVNIYRFGKPKSDICHSCSKKRQLKIYGHPLKGRHPSKETLLKMSKSLKGKMTADKNPNWNGGRYLTQSGYVEVAIYPDNFFYSMGRIHAGSVAAYVKEHRLVMAQHLGRCLYGWEVVHHKNGIKDDNRIENLELTTKNAHHKDHSKGYQDGYKKGIYDGKDARIKELESRIRELETLIPA
jgi:hypothetical protein